MMKNEKLDRGCFNLDNTNDITCIRVLNFKCVDLTCRVMSRNVTMMLVMSRVTEFFLNEDIPRRTLPMVGKPIKVSSKLFPPTNKRSDTCFRTETMLLLAI